MNREDGNIGTCNDMTPPGRALTSENDSACEHHQPSSTPAIVRARQSRKEFQVSSPSDALMSPCTQKLFGNGLRAKKSGSIPLAMLKEKQKTNIANMDLETDKPSNN